MGLLPFEDWFYHLSARRAEVTGLHRDLIDREQSISDAAIGLRRDFITLRQMTAYNGVLALAIAAATVGSSDWAAALQSADKAETSSTHVAAKKGDDVILDDLTELLGVSAAVRARHDMSTAFSMMGMKLFDKAVDNLVIHPLTEAIFKALGADIGFAGMSAAALEDVGLATAEVPTILGIEAATAVTVAATGIGIVVSIGIDIILSAISGAVEAQELDDAIGKLKDAIDKLDAFIAKQKDSAGEVAKALITQRTTAVEFIRALAPFDHGRVDPTIDLTGVAASVALAQQQAAVRRYGQFFAIRLSVSQAIARDPAVSGDAIAAALMLGGPKTLNPRQIDWYWDVLARVSTEMQTTHPTAHPELACSRVVVRNGAGVTTPFRLGWLDLDGSSGTTPWSGTRLLGSAETFDLARLSIPDGAQVWPEANPDAGVPVVGRLTTRYAAGSANTDAFRLDGTTLDASFKRA